MPKANAKHNASDSCEGGPAEKQPRANICIIHTEGIKDCGRITLISNLPDPTRRFHEICDIRDRRLRAPSNSSERRQYSCSLVPNALEDHHGYHRNCYKWFVNHLDKLPVHDDNEPSPSLSEDPSTSARRSGNIGKVDHVLFQEDCIFCNKDGRHFTRKSPNYGGHLGFSLVLCALNVNILIPINLLYIYISLYKLK